MSRCAVLGLLGLASLANGADRLAHKDDVPKNVTCPGQLNVGGVGPVTLINAYWNVPYQTAGKVELIGGRVTPYMLGRTYFGTSCSTGAYETAYHPSNYLSLQLLGKELVYTTDMSGAECGCNAALYLTSLPQSKEVSGCYDYYCDANTVCWLKCAEIDLQEANKYSWHSTLHIPTDPNGVAAGYGGGGNGWNGPRDWKKEDYGPGGRCIDTTRPFQVAVGFPTNSAGRLAAMRTTLSQSGKPCTLTTSISSYNVNGQNALDQLTDALAPGMTPIISYWSSKDMLWMDGKGGDGLGPCAQDTPDKCSPSVSFSDFSVRSIASALIHP